MSVFGIDSSLVLTVNIAFFGLFNVFFSLFSQGQEFYLGGNPFPWNSCSRVQRVRLVS